MRGWLWGCAIELSVALALVWIIPAAVFADTPRYRVPLTGRATVVTDFDPPEHRWLPGHRGVDLAATTGMGVQAAGAGSVRFAGEVAGRPVVSIAHPDGIVTTYEPVSPTVSTGAVVSAGQLIGTIDGLHPGCPVGFCLHWGARVGSGRSVRYLDPLALVGAARVRLKPVADD